MKPKIIFMPHANIQYSQLNPKDRPWVMENCYGKLFDLIAKQDYKIAFEASGKTIDDMAVMAPEVLDKLKALIKSGRVEPVASPYIHVMVSNIPRDLCLHSLRHSRDAWERHTGVRPVVGWNPECSWASYIPEIYKEAGFETLVMDADSFLLSFPEIRQATGLRYDVQGHSNKTELFKIEEYIKDHPEYIKFLTNPSRTPEGINMIFRSDCMANILLWYLMGATEGARNEKISLDEISAMYERWKGRIDETGTFIMPYAEDAEYIGSTAYFYVKQFNEARFFEPEPESIARFQETVDAALASGYELALPSEVIHTSGKILENPYTEQIEQGVAWHGGTARAWLNTEHALLLDPVCHSVFDGICEIQRYRERGLDELDIYADQAMKALASAWVSDSRWPPLPTSPGRFNVKESIEDLYEANRLIRQSMKLDDLEEKRALYSPGLMETQIRFVERKLMDMEYFEEGQL